MDAPRTPARHVPVALARCLELLSPALSEPGSIYVDGTLGLGGHCAAILAANPQARAIGIDRDPAALDIARERLAPYAGRVSFFHGTYDEIAEAAASAGAGRVQAILLDLGLSSLQIDQAGRGFAYAQDAPLDMRMDPSQELTAAGLLREAGEGELARILRTYGDERFARQIARAIVRRRETEPLTTSAQLAELVSSVIPAPARRTGGNPAKRTFQALRIAVNDELGILARTLPRALNLLAVGGRIVVLAYHSGEDRMVKRALAAGATSSAPPGLPVEPEETKPYLRLLTRGAERPCDAEVAGNPRSASVRIRGAMRITERMAE